MKLNDSVLTHLRLEECRTFLFGVERMLELFGALRDVEVVPLLPDVGEALHCIPPLLLTQDLADHDVVLQLARLYGE